MTSLGKPPNRWHTLLILGRVSNLPTVWSNCLAGWLLAGGGFYDTFLVLCFGATCLYLGGMFLNDAFDVDFDRQHRAVRPIPTGAISLTAVWQWGLAWLLVGLLCVSLISKTTALLAALLALNILIYDAIHKIFAFSPILMASCRFLLVLVAASTGFDGVTGLSIWSALVLALYVLGISFLARRESFPGAVRFWPCLFLVAPSVLAFIVNDGRWAVRGILISGLLVLWILYSLRHAYWSPHPHVGRTVAGLLMGIIIVDFLAVGGGSLPVACLFVLFFALAWLAQRFIPAT